MNIDDPAILGSQLRRWSQIATGGMAGKTVGDVRNKPFLRTFLLVLLAPLKRSLAIRKRELTVFFVLKVRHIVASRPRETVPVNSTDIENMTKPHRRLKKANHGARPANSKARKAKRRKVKTRV